MLNCNFCMKDEKSFSMGAFKCKKVTLFGQPYFYVEKEKNKNFDSLIFTNIENQNHGGIAIRFCPFCGKPFPSIISLDDFIKEGVLEEKIE